MKSAVKGRRRPEVVLPLDFPILTYHCGQEYNLYISVIVAKFIYGLLVVHRMSLGTR